MGLLAAVGQSESLLLWLQLWVSIGGQNTESELLLILTIHGEHDRRRRRGKKKQVGITSRKNIHEKMFNLPCVQTWYNDWPDDSLLRHSLVWLSLKPDFTEPVFKYALTSGVCSREHSDDWKQSESHVSDVASVSVCVFA